LSGDKLITYTQGKHQPKVEYRCKREGLFETGKLVVLCDEESASASEILLGALQDWKRATIVGRRSFGKGLVQEQYDLQNGAALRLTVARYYTPNGRSIQRPYNKNRDNYFIEQAIDDSTRQGGIVPDFRVNTDAMKWSDSLANARIFERLREWSYRYVQTHPTLNKGKSDTTNRVENINIQPSDWQQALSLRISDTVTVYLNQYVKALIGRMLVGNGAFFSIMNQQDPFVKAGLNTLKN
jgi:carboxyl-terminal processing protease